MRSAIPNRWEEVVAACLSKDPAMRPATAGEVAARLLDRSPVDPGKLKKESGTAGGAAIASPTPRTLTTSATFSLGSDLQASDAAAGDQPPARKRGCTFTVVLTLCLTAMLGGHFVQESIRQAYAPRNESFTQSTPTPVEQAPSAPLEEPSRAAPPVENEASKYAAEAERQLKERMMAPEQRRLQEQEMGRAREMARAAEEMARQERMRAEATPPPPARSSTPRQGVQLTAIATESAPESPE